MRTVKMEKDENGYFDLVLENGAFVIVDDGDAVPTLVAERLLSDKLEAAANPIVDTSTEEKGTDYFGIIFPLSVPDVVKQLHIKKRILETTGAISIESFQWSQSGGNLTYSARVNTTNGVIEVTGGN